MNVRGLLQPAFVLSCAVMVAAASVMSVGISYFKVYLRKAEIYPESKKQLLSLPAVTRGGGWVQVSQDEQMSLEIQEVLGTQNHVTRVYQKKQADGKGVHLQLHAAYYTGMIDTVPHVPDRCFVGAGMDLTGELGDLPISLDTSDWREDTTVPEPLRGQIYTARSSDGVYPRLPRKAKDAKLRTMKFQTPGTDRVTYAGYFFVANGGTVARAEGVRLLAFNLSDYYAYYLKVQFTTSEVATTEEFLEASASLLSEMYPDLMRCVPDWVAVEQGTYPPDNPKRAEGSKKAEKESGS